jgi:dihydroorotate dehydrogenase
MGSNLHTLLKNINIERKKLEDKLGKILQVWLKISPDLNNNELKNLIDISVKYNIDALCISNTTTYRSNTLISKNKKEIGGLSGPPLFSQSTKMLAKAYLHASKSIKFIGIGGISNGETAYSKILAGANIIQLYTGLVFHGPQIINDIINYLDSKCKKTKITNFVGSQADFILEKK